MSKNKQQKLIYVDFEGRTGDATNLLIMPADEYSPAFHADFREQVKIATGNSLRQWVNATRRQIRKQAPKRLIPGTSYVPKKTTLITTQEELDRMEAFHWEARITTGYDLPSSDPIEVVSWGENC
jgi:predicted RNA-binding protein